MPRPRRARKVAKWVGIATCVLIAACWAFTLRLQVGYRRTHGGLEETIYGMTQGAIGVTWLSRSGLVLPDGGHWFAEPADTSEIILWVQSGGGAAARGLWVPMWMPFALFALPTAYLWWADSRQARPGRCPRCRYDLAGLPAGSACPECGRSAS